VDAYVLWCFERSEAPRAGDLAERLGMTVSRLYREMRKLVGMSPGAYVKGIQLIHAERYLQCTSMTLPEIILLTGYANLQTFHRTFQREHGCTPEEYRRSMRPGWRQRHTRS
jgi:AraC-like DNA-binding protein